MCPAFIKAAKTISTERLHDANVNVGVVVAQEGFAIEGDETAQRVKIMIEKLLAEVGWEIGLGVIQERGNVILQSAFAATLIVDEIRIAVAQKDVAGLKVAIEKIIARGAEKEFEEGGVFFADAIENADGPAFLVGQPNDFAAGAAEFALQRHDAVGRRVEMLLEEFLENVH